jgi:hypothetical protein
MRVESDAAANVGVSLLTLVAALWLATGSLAAAPQFTSAEVKAITDYQDQAARRQ